MDALEAIMTRQSIRSYTGEGISRQMLRQIVSAGMQAPSAHACASWRFLTITDRETMRGIIPYSPWWGLLEEAAALIVVCTDTRGVEGISLEFQVDGCAAAMENMLLAVHAMGLGGVWLGVCEGEENCCLVKARLKLPGYTKLIGTMAVGHPAKRPEWKDRFEPQKWFEEDWGNQLHPD